MKMIKTVLRRLILGVGAIISSSCIASVFNTVAHLNDFDPYSDNRNENRSLVGFYLNGSKYYESHDAVIVSQMTTLVWSIVTLDNNDYILAIVPTGWGEGSQPKMFAELYLLMPFHNVVIGEEYHSFLRSAIAIASDEKAFIINGEAYSSYFSPIELFVRYTKTDNVIQGSFEATGGSIETTLGDLMNITLNNGLFNLVYSDGYRKSITYDYWLSSILNHHVFNLSEEDNADTIADWKSMTTDN